MQCIYSVISSQQTPSVAPAHSTPVTEDPGQSLYQDLITTHTTYTHCMARHALLSVCVIVSWSRDTSKGTNSGANLMPSHMAWYNYPNE